MGYKYGKESSLYRHGLSYTPEYRAWESMVQRCNPRNKYVGRYYAKRGIKVCDRWKDPVFFIKDMGKRPTSLHSLDRIDTNGDYKPSNCRWATKLEQTLNRGINRNNKTGFKGVSYRKERSRYLVQARVEGCQRSFGLYRTAEEAAIAYDQVAIQLRGDTANLNFL